MWVLVIWKVSTAESEDAERERNVIFRLVSSVLLESRGSKFCIRAGPSTAFLHQFMSHQQHFAFHQVDVLLAVFMSLGKNNKCVW